MLELPSSSLRKLIILEDDELFLKHLKVSCVLGTYQAKYSES